MTSVTKVHLSVDTIFMFFLFFHIDTLPTRDSDRSDKRAQSQKRQGIQACDKSKPSVTKGFAYRLRGLLSHRCFAGCSSVMPLLQGMQAFVTFVTVSETQRASGVLCRRIYPLSRFGSSRKAQFKGNSNLDHALVEESA